MPDHKSSQPRILFVCTGNSCRSQMAEGWARHLAGGRVRISSAGIVATALHPLAVQVMAEAGVDISPQVSKSLTPRMIQESDIVVTVCANAEQQCPAVPRGATKYHWPIYDPVSFDGVGEDRIAMFRVVRDEIREHVTGLLRDHNLLDVGGVPRVRREAG